mgnify:CR=1 FL=1
MNGAAESWPIKSKKKQRGYYLRIDYCGGGDLVSEMERQFRIDDRVMKYMTILLDTEADMERIQEAMTQAEQEAEAAATASEPAESLETATEAVAEAAPVETEPETSPESTDSEAKKEEA